MPAHRIMHQLELAADNLIMNDLKLGEERLICVVILLALEQLGHDVRKLLRIAEPSEVKEGLLVFKSLGCQAVDYSGVLELTHRETRRLGTPQYALGEIQPEVDCFLSE